MNINPLRMRRIVDPNSGKLFIVPLDHGVSMGPIPGLSPMNQTVSNFADCDQVNAVILHKGIISACMPSLRSHRELGVIVHLSASTALAPDSNAKELVTSVEESVRLGADGVSMQVNLGARTESKMLSDLGRVSDECHRWDMPLIAMMYVRGGDPKQEKSTACIAHAARVAEEFGASVVKLTYPGSSEALREITSSVEIPVVIAGGPRFSDTGLLHTAEESMLGGGAGICFGRSVFQSRNPLALCRALGRIVHEGWPAEMLEREVSAVPELASISA